MNDEQLIWEAYSAIKKPKPISLGIDNLVLIKRKAGDVYNYVIFDYSEKPRKMIGHISGFESDYGRYKDTFHLYKTELTEETRKNPKYHNKGIYRTAIQKVANLYPNGLYVRKMEASGELQRSLAKMPTYEFIDNEVYLKDIFIRPENYSK
jgi:muconolactone delta-isomerase